MRSDWSCAATFEQWHESDQEIMSFTTWPWTVGQAEIAA